MQFALGAPSCGCLVSWQLHFTAVSRLRQGPFLCPLAAPAGSPPLELTDRRKLLLRKNSHFSRRGATFAPLKGVESRGGCIPPQIVVYCCCHGQPARVDRNKLWYTVYTVTGSLPAWIEMSIKTPKQKAPTLAGEGLCFMRACRRACRRAWRCSCACPCGSGAYCSGSFSWSTPPLRSHSLLASGISPARPPRPARPCFRPLWLAAAVARPAPAPFRAVPYTRPLPAPVCPKRAAL